MLARAYWFVREWIDWQIHRLVCGCHLIQWTERDNLMAQAWMEENTPWGEVQRYRTEDGVDVEQPPLPFDQDAEENG